MKQLVSSLIDLLNQERESILSGDLSQIEEFSERKEELIAILQDELAALSAEADFSAGIAEMKYLNEMAEQNAFLLRSVASGTRNAIDRLSSVSKQNCSVGAYGEKGNALYLSKAQISQKKTV